MPFEEFLGGVIVGAAGVGVAWWIYRLLRRPVQMPTKLAVVVESDGGDHPPAFEKAVDRTDGPRGVWATPPRSGLAIKAQIPRPEELRVDPTPNIEANPEFPDGPREEPIRISHRVLLHIARQGALGPSEVATVEYTQRGMVEALEVTQGALTGVLRRLVAAGVLSVALHHVRGQRRRFKVYCLTSAGEAFVRELRTQGTTGPHSDRAPSAVPSSPEFRRRRRPVVRGIRPSVSPAPNEGQEPAP